MSVIPAIQSGDLSALKAALASNPSLANEKNEQGVSALLLSLYYRRKECAEALLFAGAHPDFPTLCAIGRVDEASRMLTDKPELLHAYTCDGWTPLHLAAFFCKPAMVRWLLMRGADPQARSTNQMANLPLHAAAAGRSVESVRLLLEAGTPVNATQHGGYTALHTAMQNADTAMIELLLSHGADADLAAGDGRTPASMRPQS